MWQQRQRLSLIRGHYASPQCLNSLTFLVLEESHIGSGKHAEQHQSTYSAKLVPKPTPS